MIISHRFKFIFWKPTKVASSSVLHRLGYYVDRYGGPDDVVGELRKNGDGFGKNQEAFAELCTKAGLSKYCIRDGRFDLHIPPADICKIVGEDIFNSYYKFTIVRNPWDECVSRLYHNIKRGVEGYGTHKPKYFLKSNREGYDRQRQLQKDWNRLIRKQARHNYDYYFSSPWNDQDGCAPETLVPWANYYIRYENLNEDFEKICDKYDFGSRKPLGFHKSTYRDRDFSYHEYFTRDERRFVKHRFRHMIDFFGYKF